MYLILFYNKLKNQKMKRNVLLALSTLLLMSCGAMHHKVIHQEKNIHWSYAGDGNPENWSYISEAYKDCGGKAQSPINIETQKVKQVLDKHSLKINYNSSKVNIVNNGHTVQFNISAKNNLIFNGKSYELKQFHLHSLSEHTIDSKYSPLEVHFVNKATDNTYAVISVLFKEGDVSPFFEKFLSKLPKKEGKYSEDQSFVIREMLSQTSQFYHYKGSFTTPPCTEVVEWIVLTERLTASKTQLDQLHALLDNNYRPTQLINKREVELQK